ncbi:MAG: cob(I)yrinic acid a,c-diamide adenosyltransferase [Ignavibacteria bacterium]|nr:cob(I)yrinic acid a,c-diamide adenosyltransferase [Ignavibacteria bacterium]
MKGYIQVYTGNGKGKTTAAIGLAIRAAGAGKKVFFAQFVKGMIYSEVKALENLSSNITIKQYGLDCFIYNVPTQADIDAACNGFNEVSEIIFSDKYDIIVLDEANIALYYKLFSIEELIDLLKRKPEQTEIIITGRYAPDELIEFADLVSEIKEIKHYYTKGIQARKGIEY